MKRQALIIAALYILLICCTNTVFAFGKTYEDFIPKQSCDHYKKWIINDYSFLYKIVPDQFDLIHQLEQRITNMLPRGEKDFKFHSCELLYLGSQSFSESIEEEAKCNALPEEQKNNYLENRKLNSDFGIQYAFKYNSIGECLFMLWRTQTLHTDIKTELNVKITLPFGDKPYNARMYYVADKAPRYKIPFTDSLLFGSKETLSEYKLPFTDITLFDSQDLEKLVPDFLKKTQILLDAFFGTLLNSFIYIDFEQQIPATKFLGIKILDKVDVLNIALSSNKNASNKVSEKEYSLGDWGTQINMSLFGENIKSSTPILYVEAGSDFTYYRQLLGKDWNFEATGEIGGQND